MNQEEFGRLLQTYMFGKSTPEQRQRLAEAAMESPEWSLEFAQAEEIREHLSDSKVRQDLLAMLPAVRVQDRQSWWRSWAIPRFGLALAGGAAIVIVALLIRDLGVVHEQPIARAPGPVVPGRDPAVPPPVLQLPNDGGALQPATIEDSSASAMAALFQPEATAQSGRFGLTLTGGTRYRGTDRVSAAFTLVENGRVYAIVQGPTGLMREVYPSSSGPDLVLPPGLHSFSFAAAGGIDPEIGQSRLRIFVAQEEQAPISGAERWTWLKANSVFEEAEYEIAAR